MIRNYFTTASRSITKNKSFSVLNIAGLALGISSALLILLWVQDELSVDQFHVNGDQLYQVYQRNYYDGKVEGAYQTQGLLAQELTKGIPEIEYASGMEYVAPPGTSSTFSSGDQTNKMTGFFVGADFLRMFSYPVLHGDVQSALIEPNAIAISRKMAESFFGIAENAVGNIIRFENKEDLQITAVFENPPNHASQQFDFLRVWDDFIGENAWVHQWDNTSPATYVQLRAGADREQVVGQTIAWGNRSGEIIGVLRDFHFTSFHQAIEPLIVRLDENWTWGTILIRTKAGNTKEAIAIIERLCKELNPKVPFTYQFSDLEFSNLYKSEEIVGKLSYCFALLAILISCLGLFGLSAFTAEQRTKEIGIRKVLGASVSSVVALLSKDFTKLVLVAVVIACPLAWWAMDNWLARFAYRIAIEWWMFAIAGSAALIIALMTVSFQAIKAAIANPVESLRDE